MVRHVLFLLGASSFLLQAAPVQPISEFFRDTFEQLVQQSPEFATSIGRHEHDDRWTDLSKAARAQRHEFLVGRLHALEQYPADSLSPEDRLSVRIVKYDFQTQLEAWDLDTHLLAVGQLFGFHNRVYSLIDRMPARTVRDYENIIARLRAIPTYVDQNIAIQDEAIAMKMTQPKVVADLVVKQIDTQMHQEAAHSELLTTFRKFPSNIPTAEQQRLTTAANDAYDNQFLPAWHKLHDYMATTYTQHVRPTDSLSSLPDGKQDYRILIRSLTTTDTSPEEIHRIGEQELKRIEGEMQDILQEVHFTGTLAEFEEHLNHSPDQLFHSKEEMLIYCRNIAKIIEPELPNQFRNIPKLLYGVRPIPPDREAATATNAQAPSPDFTTPGWFNLNTYEPEKQVKYDKESLVLHEAVPGHIFQITLARSQGDLPELRKFYHNSAYIEGWALYSESLGAPLGLYRDPYSRFGQLASERFRAVRLVVDTGIHEMGWSRAQALDFFQTHAPGESMAEIDRYISWPAQALSYKMGQLRIRQLRTEAESKLGTKFDVRLFHDAVLRGGTLPLDVLTDEIHNYEAVAMQK